MIAARAQNVDPGRFYITVVFIETKTHVSFSPKSSV